MTSTAPPDRTNAAAGTPPDPSADPPADATAGTQSGQIDTAPAPADDASPAGGAPSRTDGWRDRLRAAARRPAAADVAVTVLFLLVAAWLTAGLWPDPNNRVLALNAEDQTLYEWFLANDARVLLGDFSLVTDRLNAPEGVNLMANTTVIALGFLFAPITLAFGAGVTFALIAATNLAVTGLAWHLLFARVLGAHRLAAAIGGAFCGFAPGMISQNNSHLHMTAQWLVPVMVWCVVRMIRAAEGRDNRRLIGAAVTLAAVVSLQVFIGEEVLFLTALTLALMTLVYAALRPALLRRAGARFAAAMLLAVVVAGAVLAYPLWTQFAGPQGVHNGLFSPDYFSADLASWSAISPMSLAGSPEAARLSTGPAEYNTFLGWPLLAAAVGCALWLWRRPLAVAAVVAGLIMAALSLGPNVVIAGVRTTVPGPYRLLHGLPLVDGALPMRFALALIPLIATILVLAVDRALADRDRAVRIAVPAAVVAALLPIAPMPVDTSTRTPVPVFFSAGHWRDCVAPGGVLVPVPLPTPQEPWPMRWAASQDVGFALPEGFFIGPYGGRGKASMGTFKQPTSQLLADVATTGQVPGIDDGHRQQARSDLDFWGASCVVLTDETQNAGALRGTLETLLGPGARVADAWTWKVSPARRAG